jgi:glycosyltransferase involved in cell wall biosynthesis
MAALYERYGKTDRLSFSIQFFAQPQEVAFVRGAYHQMLRFPPNYVTLALHAMSPEAYFQCLGAADGVLIPYVGSIYRRRSSGILAEALAAGKPAVVPESTWMALQVGPRRGVTFADPRYLAEAIAQLVDRFDPLSGAAKDFAPAWRSRHSPDALVACLLDAARQASVAV